VLGGRLARGDLYELGPLVHVKASVKTSLITPNVNALLRASF
jgi:hypothetical protein